MTLNRDDLVASRQRKYCARDFGGMRSLLLEYARVYYPTRLKDFSESSLGGLFLDLAAFTADNCSFYLDHQYGELDPQTAVETSSIQRLLRAAGVPIVGSSPAIVPVTIYVQVPAATINNVVCPMLDALPVVRANSSFTSNGGVVFSLLEDVNFTQTLSDGSLAADARIGTKTSAGIPLTFILAQTGLAISGQETTESVVVGAAFVPYNRISLQQPNVSQVISVSDSLGNIYYQVGALTQDVVYRNVLNTAGDNDLVPDAIKIVPAPYRFTLATDLQSRMTTLTFGGGNAETMQDDIIPDPSTFAIAFPYSRTFSRIPVNPQQLLGTTTTGVAAANTTYTITYRYGGGLNHNAAAGTIQTPRTLDIFFPGNPSPQIAGQVRSTIEVNNKVRASGGEDAPSADELKLLIPATKNSQERIVTREDLLARVYTIPSNFGRVFRAAIRSNPNNPLATQLFIISRDANGQLITSPDTLKTNLVKYLNPYRMISDAVDVLDARVINYRFSFAALIDSSLNRATVLQNALTKLKSFFNIANFHIDQPIILGDLQNLIHQVPGIISLNSMRFDNVVGLVNNVQYSDVTYDMTSNTRVGLVLPPAGGIFNLKNPEFDLIGKASV